MTPLPHVSQVLPAIVHDSHVKHRQESWTMDIAMA